MNKKERVFNIISIKAKSIIGNKGKTTALNICEDALVKHGYTVTGNDEGHTLFAEKEDVLHPGG